MKRARIMLSAVAVVALVGAALAFKANIFNVTVFCTDNSFNACSIETPCFSLTGTVPVLGQTYCTDEEHSDQPCPLTTLYVRCW